MHKVSIVDNKPYRIVRVDNFEIYAIKKHGLFYIYAREDKNDYLWLNEGYTDIKIQLRNDSSTISEYCYLMLKDGFGFCTIIEILSKSVKKCFNDYQCIRKYKRKIEIDNKELNDIVYVLWDKDDMWYCVWSLMKGYLFNTYDYSNIKQYSCGAILDNKIAVDIEGYLFDISSYEEINYEGIYYSKEKNDYLYLLNDNRTLFIPMEEDPEDENIIRIELDDKIITYNKVTEEFFTKHIESFEDDWSQYNDTAFEGYSRLELGLDD